MRLLHTADWHLGKTLKGENLLDDQEFIIDKIFGIIDDEKPDAILICGDIYDRAVPPPKAVDLFNDTLNRFAERNLPTLIIAGNHDSAARLNFGSKLFERQKIFIVSKITDEPEQIILRDEFGEVYFTPIPFFVPGEIHSKFFDADADRLNCNDANKFFVDRAREKIPAGKRSVALAHVFLTGGVESESERKFVGGAENVDAQIFFAYNYVALGHLHAPQKISAENIRYAGSPLKYSFDEVKQKKSVTIVDIDAAGNVTTKEIPLKPRRDVRIVNGTLAELKNFAPTEDYISAQLTERVINVQDKLANIFPNMLNVEFILEKTSSDDGEKKNSRAKISTLDYFADFFNEQTGEILSDDYRAAMADFLAELDRDEREA